MKVLQLGKFYPIRGGVEKVMWDLTGGLGERGTDCDMLCACEEPGTIVINPHARCIRVRSLAKVAATMISPAMITWLRRHCGEYDIVHIHHPDPMAALALRLSGYKGRVILHWHSDILKQKTLLKFYRPLQDWLLRRAEKIVGTTPVYVAQSPFLQGCQSKCTYAQIGIKKIDFNTEKVVSLQNTYRGKKLIFSLGRLVGYKGYSFLVEAAKYLPEDFLVVIGGDGPLRGELEAQIRSGNLVEKVKLPGYMSDEDAHAWMKAADVFVLPSVMKTEAFGIVQIEAMSVGTPVVATKIPQSGTAWVNGDGVSGRNVEIGNPEALAEAIAELCSGNREKWSEGASERFRTTFTLDKMIEKIEKIYNNEN